MLHLFTLYYFLFNVLDFVLQYSMVVCYTDFEQIKYDTIWYDDLPSLMVACWIYFSLPIFCFLSYWCRIKIFIIVVYSHA